MQALLFPGQGSQSPGMGKFLYDEFEIARKTFEEASDAIAIDFKKLCFEGTDRDLALTENTQPCLLLVSTATHRVLQNLVDLKIGGAAGHSVGEYAALVAANAISFSDAIKAVRIRGQAMQSAVPVGQGGMAAVMGLNEVEIEELCQFVEKKSSFTPLSPANFNSPGQIVISGVMSAIEWLRTQFKSEDLWPNTSKRIKVIPLNVSAPFHCSMMKPAEERMRKVLNEIPFQDAQFSIVQNFTAKGHREANDLKENLIRQISAPVKWQQSVMELKQRNLGFCIESGSGKVLQGLVKKIDSEFFQVFNTNSLEDLKTIEMALKAQSEAGKG